jgi:NADPH-dependent curcumin reductase CurA
MASSQAGHQHAEFLKQMSAWAALRAIQYREQLVEGVENAPEAFMGMMVR